MDHDFEDPTAEPPWQGDPWDGDPEGVWGHEGDDEEDEAGALSAQLEQINSRFSELQEGVRAAVEAARGAEEARGRVRAQLALSRERALRAVAQRWGELGERVEREHARVQRSLQEEISRLSLALETLHVAPTSPSGARASGEQHGPPEGSRGSLLPPDTLDWGELDMGPVLEAIAEFGPRTQAQGREEERGPPPIRSPLRPPRTTPRAPPDGALRLGAPPRGRSVLAGSHSTPKATGTPRGARSLPRNGIRAPSPGSAPPKSSRPRALTPVGRLGGAPPHSCVDHGGDAGGLRRHGGDAARRHGGDAGRHGGDAGRHAEETRRLRDRDEEEGQEEDEDGLLFQFGRQGRGMGEFMNAQGVAVTPSGRIIVADSGKHSVQVFLSTGEFLTQFGVRGRDPGGMVSPCGVAVRANGDLLVADPETRSVNVYAPDGRHRAQLGVGLLQAPRGVCTTASGLALVSDHKACSVVALTAAGKVQAKFGGRAADLGRLRGPNYVALNSKGDVIVSDFLDHSVKVFSGGEFLFQLGGFGSGEGQLNGPTGVAVDPSDNIIVADWGNARIQVFNCVGAFKGMLAPTVWPLSGPQGLALSPEGSRLVVADTGNHCCKVYRYTQP